MKHLSKYTIVHSEINNLRFIPTIPIKKFKNLLSSLKKYIELCKDDEKDELYYTLLEIYHDLHEIKDKTTSKNNVSKIIFKTVSNKIHDTYLIKMKRLALHESNNKMDESNN